MDKSMFSGGAPDWLSAHLEAISPDIHTDQQRMRWVIALARKNIDKQTGGPFAAAVFDMDSGKPIALGVNRVEALNCSHAHAEMMALAAAEQRLGSFDLGAHGMACELVSSSEPCAMCSGALPWSGIRRLVCGARAADAERIGFDEGAKHPSWIGDLAARGICVAMDVCRKEAAQIFDDYHARSGLIYNGQRE